MGGLRSIRSTSYSDVIENSSALFSRFDHLPIGWLPAPVLELIRQAAGIVGGAHP